MKKALSIVLAFVMLIVMSVTAFAGNTTITTTVPEEHMVTINHNDGGYVLVNGKLCPNGTQFKINRFGGIDLSAVLENGYHIDSIIMNGIDVTDQYIDGNFKASNIACDTVIAFVFEACANDPNDKCGKVDIEGTVFLGEKELKNAEISIDFGSVTATTDADGRYFIEDIADGKHLVTISKDGKDLAHTSFVIVREDVEETVLRTAEDGTQVVVIPLDAEKVYLDFHIIDNNNDNIPDIDPEDTDPGDPDNPDFKDPDGDPDDSSGTPPTQPDTDPDDKDKDGVVITIGGPVEPTPIIPIPDTFAELFETPIITGSLMAFSFFFIVLILFKRKKDEEDEREIIVVE